MLKSHLLKCQSKEEMMFESLFRSSCSRQPLLNFWLASPPTTLSLNPENIYYSGTVHRFFCSVVSNISATWLKLVCLYITCKYQWKFESWVLTRFAPATHQTFMSLCQELSQVKEIQSWISAICRCLCLLQFLTAPTVLLISKCISLSLTKLQSPINTLNF